MPADAGLILSGGKAAGGQGVASGGQDIVKLIGQFNNAFEYQRQAKVQRNILANNTQMLLNYKYSASRDIDNRAAIMSGQVIGRAGVSGVRASSGSVVNAAADIMAKAEVDKLRLATNVQNQINLNQYQEAELSRRGKKVVSDAVSDAFMTGVVKGVGAFATGGFG